MGLLLVLLAAFVVPTYLIALLMPNRLCLSICVLLLGAFIVHSAWGPSPCDYSDSPLSIWGIPMASLLIGAGLRLVTLHVRTRNIPYSTILTTYLLGLFLAVPLSLLFGMALMVAFPIQYCAP